jgi:hypothetical protein
MLSVAKKKNDDDKNQQSTAAAIILNDTDTEERKRWLEDIKRYQRKKDVECILERGFGYHWDMQASQCVAD